MYKIYTKILYVPKGHVPKLLLNLITAYCRMNVAERRKWIMRLNLTTILLLASLLQVSAMTFAQTVTYHKKGATLEEIFSQISLQTGYEVLFSPDLIDPNKKVDVSFKNKDLKAVLKQVMDHKILKYKIEDKNILVSRIKPANPTDAEVKPKEKTFIQKVKDVLDVPINIKGRITDTTGRPLPGAVIKVRGTKISATTNDNGEFEINGVADNAVIIVTYIGYVTTEIQSNRFTGGQATIILKQNIAELETVDIVNTGYQNISPERITGSFTKPDKTMFDARVSTDIISKLEGITSGLLFNGQGVGGIAGENDRIAIRGLSTINAERQPLIVVDNFPYDGDISNINPNDIADVTILKDAAAASIWGAYSGNGVIVITTKKGRKSQPLTVNFNLNTTISQKPNLYYNSAFIPSADLIDLEMDLYTRGQYNTAIDDGGKAAISPVVALLVKRDGGQVTETEFSNKIAELRSYDVREQKEKYLYQHAVNQQYALNISGGSNKNAFYMSVGYDNNSAPQKKSNYERLTLNFDNTYTPIKNLNLNAGINYIRNSRDIVNADISGVTFANLPYVQIADNDGNPLPVVSQFSPLYTETVKNKGFLNWDWYPLKELNDQYNTSSSQTSDIRLTTGIDYTFLNGFKASIKYQWQQGVNSNQDLFTKDSYYTRNLINQFSILNETGNVTGYNLPIGAIISNATGTNKINNIRGQLDYIHKWGNHELNAIAGIEAREFTNKSHGFGYYGYDEATGIFANVNTTMVFATNPSSSGTISQLLSSGGTLDRYRSYYSNAAYTYNDKYTLTGSGRIDQSNLFGVEANQRSNPLWSTGFRWNLSKEGFYQLKWLPKLNFRTTYGFNGNLSKSITAVTTFQYWPSDQGNGYTQLNSASVSNIGNPSLTWEKIGILNIGIDYAFKNDRISGSIDFFTKRGKDLVGNQDMAPSSGLSVMRGNYANMKGNGFDVQINSINLKGNGARWESSLIVSHATDRVTQYAATVNPTTSDGVSLNPMVGYPVYSVIAYRWAGLDPITGDPRGFDKDGNISKDYTSLINPNSPNQLVYVGPGRPTWFGGLQNTLVYQQLSLSFNISYKFDYYFLRRAIGYNNLFNVYALNSDYLTRWKKPGDEAITNVPSIDYSANRSRDSFNQLAESNVEKGDHIRLQDITLSYSLPSFLLKALNFRSVQVYAYANNLGLLWKSTKTNLDPDFVQSQFVNPKTIAFGIKAGF